MSQLHPSDTNSLEEKGKHEHQEYAQPGTVNHADHPALQVTPEFAKKTIRKVDVRLLIILSAIYAVSLIDRTNISVARVAGMATALDLNVGERYSIITLIFFVPYIIFELPCNLLIRKIGPRTLLSSITVAWGAVMLGMGFVTSWTHLVACRFLLGLLESGFFPGCVFLISCFYTRHELQKRMSVFYLTSMVISGFSNILGYAISLLEGRNGLGGWQWIFIIFGIVTIALGLLAFFLIVDFPDRATFLNTEQRDFVIARVNADRGDAEADVFTMKKGLKHAADLKLWAFGFIFLCSTMPAYAFSYFLPVILAGGGYDRRLSLCLSAPPYVFAAIYTFASAVISDKRKNRAIPIAVSATVCMVGLLIMAYAGPLGVRYFGSFLAIAGAQSNVPAALTYQANNVRSHSKRAVSSAICVGMGGVGGIIASTVFRQADFPRYMPGLWTTIGLQIAILTLLATLSFYFRRRNAQAAKGERELEGSSLFRYTL